MTGVLISRDVLRTSLVRCLQMPPTVPKLSFSLVCGDNRCAAGIDVSPPPDHTKVWECPRKSPQAASTEKTSSRWIRRRSNLDVYVNSQLLTLCRLHGQAIMELLKSFTASRPRTEVQPKAGLFRVGVTEGGWGLPASTAPGGRRKSPSQ